MRPVIPAPLLGAALLALPSCSAAAYKDSADAQTYGLLERVSERVTGLKRTFPIDRDVDEKGVSQDTLRGRILRGEVDKVKLTIAQALDVAAENSREFQSSKESLYLTALALTRVQWDFTLRWGGGGGGEVSGVEGDATDLSLRDDLSASVNTVAGTRVVASFVNSFLRNLLSGGGGFDASSILDLTISQPLLRGAGRRIIREPLNQAERDVVYEMRSFERTRASLAIRVVSDYYAIAQQITDLETQRRNYESVKQSFVQAEALFEAGRRPLEDKDRAAQEQFSSQIRLVNAQNALKNSLDRYKVTLGLPVEFELELDVDELARVRATGATPIELDEKTAVELALSRRYDLRNTRDRVGDAARRLVVAEDALNIGLDFSAVLQVPSESGSSANLDWSNVSWAAGFDLDLALDQRAERNAYRSALISLDVAFRSRDEAEDQIVASVRQSLRNIKNLYDNYRINEQALQLAETRVEATEALFEAGRVRALEVLDAKDSALRSRLQLTDSLVSYNIAKLNLMFDMEAIVLEPQGLRFDPGLPIPTGPNYEALNARPE